MIISLRTMSYEELKERITPEDKVVVWSCNNCVKFCDKMGGRQAMNDLADKLERDGINVVRRELIGMACVLDLVHLRSIEEATREAFEEATVVIPLTCEDGVDNLRHVFPDKKILEVPKTVGLGVLSTEWHALRLTVPFEETGLEPVPEGMPLAQVAERLGLHAGPF
jgi:hypothetical protein